MLQPWQLSYNGLILGDDTPYSLVTIEGLTSSPEVDAAYWARPTRDGGVSRPDYVRGRIVTITVEIDTDLTSLERGYKLDALRTAFAPSRSDSPLTFRFPGIVGATELELQCRPRRFGTTIDQTYYYGLPLFVVELFASDPGMLAPPSGASIPWASSAGGMQFDAQFNLNFPGSGNDLALVTNYGTAPTDWIATFYGPITLPGIRNVTTDEKIEFDIELLSGEYLVVDSAKRTVMLNGTSSRYSTVVSPSWWRIPVGDSYIQLTSSSGSSPAYVSVQFRGRVI